MFFFVNQKSKNPIKNRNIVIKTLSAIFVSPLEAYFCLGENQRSIGSTFFTNTLFEKIVFGRFGDKFIEIDEILQKFDDLLKLAPVGAKGL